VRAAAAGDHEAYGALVATYQSKVYRLCLKMTHDPVAAEDLAQDVFVKVFGALPSFRYDCQFSTWLFQVAVRHCLDWRRSVDRERRYLATADMAEVSAPHEETPEQALLKTERTAQLLLLVQDLREPYRAVTRLFYLEGCTYQDIAARMGTSRKTVESQIYRARQMMRQRGDALQ
jgi:RNA polymerase sigma factor (sigma-70 family)